MKKTKMTRNQKTILLLMSLAVLCLCSFFVALIPSDISTAPAAPLSTAPAIPPAPTPLQHKKFMAQIKCERFIKNRLVSPSSAKFSNVKSYTVNGEPMNYHAVVGVVESQNRMGVLLRAKYRCDAHYLPDDPTLWVLDYLDIED